MKVNQYRVTQQILHQQNLRTKQETFFMHLQFHKTLFFPMARTVRWLRDCADPACIHMGVEHISSNQFKVDRMQVISRC